MKRRSKKQSNKTRKVKKKVGIFGLAMPFWSSAPPPPSKPEVKPEESPNPNSQLAPIAMSIFPNAKEPALSPVQFLPELMQRVKEKEAKLLMLEMGNQFLNLVPSPTKAQVENWVNLLYLLETASAQFCPVFKQFYSSRSAEERNLAFKVFRDDLLKPFWLGRLHRFVEDLRVGTCLDEAKIAKFNTAMSDICTRIILIFIKLY